jgi:hypothetical protein
MDNIISRETIYRAVQLAEEAFREYYKTPDNPSGFPTTLATWLAFAGGSALPFSARAIPAYVEVLKRLAGKGFDEAILNDPSLSCAEMTEYFKKMKRTFR